MANNAERIKFLKSAKASIERDIASLEKRGGDKSTIEFFKKQLKQIEDSIKAVEPKGVELNQDSSTKADLERTFKVLMGEAIAAKNAGDTKRENSLWKDIDRLQAEMDKLDKADRNKRVRHSWMREK